MRPPPGSGGIQNNKLMLGVLAGCGCLMILVVAGVMVAMVMMRRSAAPSASEAAASAPAIAPATSAAPAASPSAPDSTGVTPGEGVSDPAAAQYLVALGQSVFAAARGELGDERFGSPRASAIPSVVALGVAPDIAMVVVTLGASAGNQHVRTVLMAFPDGRLRAAEAKLGSRPTGATISALESAELHGLATRLGDDLLQRGRCPQLLALDELAGLPQPLIAQLTRKLGESRSECQGLRPWPGFQDAWTPRVDTFLVIARGANGPVLVEAQLRASRGLLVPSRIREPRSR